MAIKTPAKFKVNSSFNSPEHLDYLILGLYKKRTIVTGELRVIEYYSQYDGATFNDLVLKEERVFNRDANGVAINRVITITWYLTDNSIGLVKTTTKFYTPEETIQEGIDRRTNIIADAKIYVLNAIGQAYGFDLLLSVLTQILVYVHGYHQPLIDAVNASTKPYLTAQMKTDIVNILTF